MNSDLIQVISYYLDIDDFYRTRKLLKTRIDLYLKYAKCPTGQEESFLKYKLKYDKLGKNIKDKKISFYNKFNDIYRSKVWNEKNYFDWACYSGYLELVKILPKIESSRAFDFACRSGHFEMVKYLYENYIYTWENRNTIYDGIQTGNLEMLEYMDSKLGTNTLKIALKDIKAKLIFPENINSIIMEYVDKYRIY